MSMLVLVLAAAGVPAAAPASAPDAAAPIEQVLLAPLFHRPFACMEHPEGQLRFPGDALGADCLVVGGLAESGYMKFFRGDGRRNADWYGWRAEVFAPLDGEVVTVRDNPVTNAPGHLGKPPAAAVAIRAADGTTVVLAHLQDIRVRVGQHVATGEFIALDGNNGVARSPHVHVGAFREQVPLQIRWDLRVEGQVLDWSR